MPGSMCEYASGRRAIAEACSPALVANADGPTYGCLVSNGRLARSAMVRAVEASAVSRPSGSSEWPRLSSRLAMTENRSALPHRSP